MFTGIVRNIGEIKAVNEIDAGVRWEIKPDDEGFFEGLRLGDSIMHDGVCLTVCEIDLKSYQYSVEIIHESLRCTTFDNKQVGSLVHLEKSLTLQDRLDGHLVSGHVDSKVRVLGIDQAAGEFVLELELPHDAARFVATKGSITINGVSLTVAKADLNTFEVALIPETLERTNFNQLKTGDFVNLEYDMLARYLDRFAQFK